MKKLNNNQKRKTIRKLSTIITAATIMAVVASVSMILGTQTEMLQNALAQTNGTTTAAANTTVTPNPSQSANKEFWVNTVHLDGITSLHAAVANPTSAQNPPLHTAETPPINSTIPTGGGFRIVLPKQTGAWDFRSITFSPDQ